MTIGGGALIRSGTVSVSSHTSFSALWGSATGSQATRKSIYSTPAAWRGIRIISDTLASLPLNLMRTESDGSTVEASDHPMFYLVRDQPSPIYHSSTWRQAKSDRIVIDGNGVSMLVKAKGQIIEMQLLAQSEWDLYERIDTRTGRRSIVYKIPTISSGWIKQNDVLHVLGPSDNGIIGMSLLEHHARVFGTHDATSVYAEELWKRGAKPSGLLTFPNTLTDKAFGRLKTSWQDEYGGPQNSGKTAIVEEGGTYKAIQMTPVDAGYGDMRTWTVSDTSRILGIPLHMLSDLGQATLDNIEQLSIQFVRHTMVPWFTRWTSELDRKLLTPQERLTLGFKFDVSDLLKGTFEDQVDSWVRLFNIGALNRNEVRDMINKNPVEDGDRFWVQGNNLVPVDLVDDLTSLKLNTQGGDLVETDTLTVKEKKTNK